MARASVTNHRSLVSLLTWTSIVMAVAGTSCRMCVVEFDRMAASMPLGRGTSPEEIADAFRFLLKAPSVTG